MAGANERAGRGLALGRLDVLEDCEFGSRLGDDLVGKWRVKIERAGGCRGRVLRMTPSNAEEQRIGGRIRDVMRSDQQFGYESVS